ncbi:MAG: class I mannose-6-phosphate isomerase [Lachnospiraceae bacterium]|nr:class I mannose-6-phosphate isomerase [Lachnospiraceae bacterium]
MSILRLKPAYLNDIWGGSRLKKEYNKSDYPGYVLSETWELSCDSEHPTIIDSGSYKGKTLKEYLDNEGAKVLGTNYERFSEWPLSVKLIDAHQNISIKVHPSIEYAEKNGLPKGNDECWYILDALPNAGIFYGVDRDVTQEEFTTMVRNNTFKKVLHFQPVKKGELYYCGPGLLHSIGAGVVVAEIKQLNQVKYRVYDFGRVRPDGNPRELMINEAKEAAILKKDIPAKDMHGHLCDCDTFTIDKVKVDGEKTLSTDGSTFHHMLVVKGDMILTSEDTRMEILQGNGFFISADHGEYRLKGHGEVLLISV